MYAQQQRGADFQNSLQGLHRINPMLAQQLQMQVQAMAHPAVGPAQLWAHAQQMWQAPQPPVQPGGWRGPGPAGNAPAQQGLWTKLFGG